MEHSKLSHFNTLRELRVKKVSNKKKQLSCADLYNTMEKQQKTGGEKQKVILPEEMIVVQPSDGKLMVNRESAATRIWS